jgi:hypothetical protein
MRGHSPGPPGRPRSRSTPRPVAASSASPAAGARAREVGGRSGKRVLFRRSVRHRTRSRDHKAGLDRLAVADVIREQEILPVGWPAHAQGRQLEALDLGDAPERSLDRAVVGVGDRTPAQRANNKQLDTTHTRLAGPWRSLAERRARREARIAAEGSPRATRSQVDFGSPSLTRSET